MRIALTLICLVAGGPAAFAQTAEPVDAMDLTCGDLVHGLRAADPGKSPSAERQREAEDAQDDIAIGLGWIHGYYTGKRGMAAMPSFNPAWMEQELRTLVASCKARSPDGKLKLIQVIEP